MKNLENPDFKAISELLSHPGTIVVITHTNPDGDALGSSLALAKYLQKKNHQVTVIVPDPFPEFLSWMPGSSEVVVSRQEKDRAKTAILNADIVIAADFNNLSRVNDAGHLVKQSSAIKVLIDHHLYPTDEFDLKISTPGTSSTSELVYDFIQSGGDATLLDKEMAECLYAGIITDTGSLSYSCNYEKTYIIIAHLIRLGVDGEHIHRLIYDTYSENRLRLLGYSISDQLVVLPEYHTAYIVLSAEDLARFDYQIGDTEDVVNYALSIKDINLAALFMERDGIVKISFRSKGHFSVDKFARNHFEGGGHSNASGANCCTPLTDTVEQFRKLLPDYQSQLKSVY